MDQSQHQQAYGTPNDQGEIIPRCFVHMDVETRLSCSKCGESICVQCMVQAPVGLRCIRCAQTPNHPTYNVSPSYYMKSSMAGGTVGLLSGLSWGIITGILPYPALTWAIALAIGHLIGYSINAATNRKRGPGLIVVAGFSLLVALITAGIIEPRVFRLMFSGLLGILALVLALFAAINRVR